MMFQVRGTLTPRFIGPFQIVEEREEELKAEFLFWSIRISGGEIHFKGVGLSHPKISNFGMGLKFTKIQKKS
jgi:hypothetical protein